MIHAHLLVIAQLVALTGLATLLCLSLAAPSRAQGRTPRTGLGPPPALAIALRLLATGRYEEAVGKLREVEESAAYRDTPYAPEAAYLAARVFRDHLHDDARAMAAYDRLATTYGLMSYPHKAAAQAERRALWEALDAANARHPLYRVLDFFVRLTGARPASYATALLLISVLIRLALWPLTAGQYRQAGMLRAMQPQLRQLQDQYKDDPERLHEEVSQLQQEHGLNPLRGCLSSLVQAPVFWVMYQAVSLYQYRFAHGTFLWIGGAFAAHHPQFLGQSLAEPDLMLLALYAVSMYIGQRLTPVGDQAVGDPTQAQAQRAMALAMPMMFLAWSWWGHTASAFVLYWLVSSVLSTATQFYHQRMTPPTPIAG